MDKNELLYILKPFFNVISCLLSTIGIALFIGCIFDFSKNTEAFVSFVSNILSDIVVSKNFLATLSKKDKEQALNLILKPLDSQIEQYANINDFFKKRLDEALTMFDTNFKTNVILNIEAHKDNEKDLVYCLTTLTYTVYKLDNKYEPLLVMLEKENSELFDLVFITPSGEEIIDIDAPSEEEIAGTKYEIYRINIPEKYNAYDHLKIQRTIKEPGSDHWIHYIWQSLTPYEGVNCRVKCFDNLIMKDFMIFDNKAYYYTNLSEDKKQLDITSSQWLDTDTGFSFIIGESK